MSFVLPKNENQTVEFKTSFQKENQHTKATLISENFPIKDKNKIEFRGSPKAGGYWSFDDIRDSK